MDCILYLQVIKYENFRHIAVKKNGNDKMNQGGAEKNWQWCTYALLPRWKAWEPDKSDLHREVDFADCNSYVAVAIGLLVPPKQFPGEPIMLGKNRSYESKPRKNR
jgi:hypothetical protein